MSEIKTTNRGGTRKGAGRPSTFTKTSDGKVVVSEYKTKINVLKEFEKLYKELNKVKTKDELLIVQAKIDLVNKLAPYSVMKKPTASLEQNEEKVPQHTILKIVSSDQDNTTEKTPQQKDDEEFV